MKNKTKWSLALFAMMITIIGLLTGCGGAEARLKHDPGKYLQTSMEATKKDLLSRYSTSPLVTMIRSLGEGSKEISLDANTTEIYGSNSVKLDLYGDVKKKSLFAEGTAAVNDMELDAMLTASPDLVGISSEALFGSNICYGVKPSDLMSQYEGSAMAEMGLIPEDTISRIDDALSRVKGLEGDTPKETLNKLKAFYKNLWSG